MDDHGGVGERRAVAGVFFTSAVGKAVTEALALQRCVARGAPAPTVAAIGGRSRSIASDVIAAPRRAVGSWHFVGDLGAICSNPAGQQWLWIRVSGWPPCLVLQLLWH